MSRLTHTGIRVLTVAIGAAVALTIGAGAAAADPGLAPLGPSLADPSRVYAGPVDGVRCVQEAVGVAADGRYGQATFDAVQAFQARHGLPVDGTVGPATGDVLLPLTSDPSYCAPYVPTSYLLAEDDGSIAGGGRVEARTYEPGNGGAVALGRPIDECVVDGVEGAVKSGWKLAKIVWKRDLPTPEEWLAAPNPIVFGGRMIYCHVLETPDE